MSMPWYGGEANRFSVLGFLWGYGFMNCILTRRCVLGTVALATLLGAVARAEDAEPVNRASIDGSEPGWRSLGEADFEMVNGDPETWTWKGDGVACTGKPVGVTRTKRQITNFELVLQWRHLSSGGNSGVFIWTAPAALEGLKPGSLPKGGIEVQVLDQGFVEQWEKEHNAKAEWFTAHGDVFPVGTAKMKPFAPVSPGGERSFPRKQLSRGTPQWNHYYIRAINGEVRLWVNGVEVSGGSDCEPRTGYLCLESEGAPVEFKGLRIRELP